MKIKIRKKEYGVTMNVNVLFDFIEKYGGKKISDIKNILGSQEGEIGIVKVKRYADFLVLGVKEYSRIEGKEDVELDIKDANVWIWEKKENFNKLLKAIESCMEGIMEDESKKKSAPAKSRRSKS